MPLDSTFTLHLLTVSVASFVASVINSIAGGGTFLTFPTLNSVAGLSEKIANMTSTVGLWPGSASSVYAAKDEFGRIPRGQLAAYAAISLLGGTLGSILLITTPSKTFTLVIPWLLLFATIVFTFSKRIGRWAGHKHGERSLKWMTAVGALQFFIAVYGGYFGAGIGVLMLAGLAFAGLPTIHQMNALKVLLATIINGVSIVTFIVVPYFAGSPDRIHFPLAGAMVVASSLGGFFGMKLARRIKADHLRAIILVVGVSLTAWYFRVYFA